MHTPLTPLAFAQRARRLYPDREAVVDGDLRLSYAQFFDRCDRWSAALQALGVRQGDRVVCISPNTHAALEAFYAVPEIGAVLVPVNYRLTPDDFAYIINHADDEVILFDSTFTPLIKAIVGQCPKVRHWICMADAANTPVVDGMHIQREPLPDGHSGVLQLIQERYDRLAP